MKKGIMYGLYVVLLAISVTACGKKETGTQSPGNEAAADNEKERVTVSEIKEAVKKAYGEDYIPNMQYDETMIEDILKLKKDWYTDIIAEGPMISNFVDTFIAAEAVPEHTKEVEKALKDYQDYLKNDTMQYPMNLEKINASQVFTIENKVFFLMLGAMNDNQDASEDEQIKWAAEQNQIGIDTVYEIMGAKKE